MANTVTEKTQLSNGVWVVPDGDKNWGAELNDNFMLLNGLLDRKTLTLTKNAQTVASFNGTQNVTVDIGTQFATNDDIDGLFGDSQTQPDLTKDVNVGNLDRFKSDLATRVVSSVSLDNNDDLEVTYLDGQSHTVSLPWPEVPTSVVDASFSSNTNNLELSLSNNTTKNVSIPIPTVPVSVVDASFSSNTNNLELTLSNNTTKNVSIPIPEVPTIPTSVVDGAIVDTNKLELTFSDQTTKQLTLPSGGSKPTTRTVTRVPVYFELHFKVGLVAESQSESYNICTANSILGITAQDVKDIIKVSSVDYRHYEDTPAPEGIIVTDVTSTKAYDEFDKAFLVAVNLAVPYTKGYPTPDGTIKFGLGKSFGDITISDSTILSAINQARQAQGEEQIESFGAQIAGSPQLSFGDDCTINSSTNYFEITAYLDNQDIHTSDGVSNDWFGYSSRLDSNCSFQLQVISKNTLDEPVTFTVSE